MRLSFKLFTIWLFIVIIFFAMQMVMYNLTTQIIVASNTTLNSTHESTVIGHMLQISDIFQIIMVLMIIGFGAAFLASAGLDIKEYLRGDQFYER